MPAYGTLRMLLAKFAHWGTPMRSGDAPSAFLHTPTDRDDLYMRLLSCMQRYDDKGRPTVFHLKANAHGTIQGNALFERKLAGVMEGLGFARCPEDVSLYSRDVGTTKEIHVLVHVDISSAALQTLPVKSSRFSRQPWIQNSEMQNGGCPWGGNQWTTSSGSTSNANPME